MLRYKGEKVSLLYPNRYTRTIEYGGIMIQVLWRTFLSMALISCAKVQDSSDTKGVGVTQNLWPNAEAEICYSTIFSGHLPGWIPDLLGEAIDTEFNSRENFFRFKNFKKCTSNDSQITVFFVSENGRSSAGGIGTQGFRTEDHGNNRVEIKKAEKGKLSATFYLSMPKSKGSQELQFRSPGLLYLMFVHELGHFVGLLHEQIHSGSNCKDETGGTRQSTEEVLEGDQVVDVGGFDKHSIMSYCFLGYARKVIAQKPDIRIGLSLQDVKTIRQLYKHELKHKNKTLEEERTGKKGNLEEEVISPEEDELVEIPQEQKPRGSLPEEERRVTQPEERPKTERISNKICKELNRSDCFYAYNPSKEYPTGCRWRFDENQCMSR